MPRRAMRIEVASEGEVLVVESDAPMSINEILRKLKIPPSTVLAVFDNTIIPHTSIIESDISIELVVVSSGG